MRRVISKPRADWRPGLRKYPYGVRAMGAGASWREDVRYEFSAHQIDLIESVADELHGMVRQAVRHVVERKFHRPLGLGPAQARLVETSWHEHWAGGRPDERAGGLVGRLTLAYDGRDSVRLVACDYDCPDGLFAASIIQRNWREALFADADQFNGLHEGLVERWEELAGGAGREVLHLTCHTPDPAREGELVYLSATAGEAGIAGKLLPIQAIGWDGRRFRDDEGAAIGWLAKRYPWEALDAEDFGDRLRASGMSVLEPAWRWVPSLHAFLALLWDLYPRHPHLCRAGLSEEDVAGAEAFGVRSNFGLDHAAGRIVERGVIVSDTGLLDEPGGHLWYEVPPGFEADGRHAMIDAWVIGDKCLGMSVRESEDPRVGPEASVVPHLFRG